MRAEKIANAFFSVVEALEEVPSWEDRKFAFNCIKAFYGFP